MADAFRPHWCLLTFVQSILGVLGTGFDILSCDELDDAVKTDVFDRESFDVLVEGGWFLHIHCWYAGE